MQMNTYHIYWKDRPIFKNLEEDDFFMIWEKSCTPTMTSYLT